MDIDPISQDTNPEDGMAEWADLLDEVDGATATFQKYYEKVIEKFGSRKRAKAKRNKAKVEVKTETQPPKPNVDEHEYDFYNPQRGLAVIINNEDFAKMKNRTGSKHDANALEKMFGHLGFHVKRHNNLTVTQMVSALHDAASNAKYDHNQADCFACAILSHGGEEQFEPKNKKDDPMIRHDVVFGVDGKLVPTRYLLSIFNDECCPELEGKPRLFFIQACRGGTLDHGEKLTYFKVTTKETKAKTEDKMAQDHKDAVAAYDSDEDSDDEFEDAEEYICPKQTPDTEESKQPAQNIQDTEGLPVEESKQSNEKQTTASDDNIEAQTTHQTSEVEKREATRVTSLDQNNGEEGKGETTTDKEGSRSIAPKSPKGGKSSSKPVFTVSPSPIYKDFLLMYAAPPGYFAWRRDTGSWLVQTLERVLTVKDVDKFSLTNLLTKVSRSVAMDYESRNPKKHLKENKLVPCVMSMLTKDVYFRNK